MKTNLNEEIEKMKCITVDWYWMEIYLVLGREIFLEDKYCSEGSLLERSSLPQLKSLLQYVLVWEKWLADITLQSSSEQQVDHYW